MRNSKQRDLVFNIVNKSYFHPTAELIYNECRYVMPNISLGTVYRNLNNLVETGNIRKIKVDDNTYRYDRNEDRHSHFLCKECNNIIDIENDLLKNIESIDGNMILDYEVSFIGVCKDCLKRKKREDLKWN